MEKTRRLPASHRGKMPLSDRFQAPNSERVENSIFVMAETLVVAVIASSSCIAPAPFAK